MEGGTKKNDRILIAIILFLILIIVILSINILTNYNKKQTPIENNDSLSEETTTDLQYNMPSSYGELADKIAEYQKSIDIADDTEKVKLLTERINLISEYGPNNKYKEQAIDDVISIDNILKTIGSAGQVINTATFYDDQDVIKKYKQIYDERIKNEGIIIDREGMG